MGLYLFIFYVIIATIFVIRKKNIFTVTLIYLTLAPDIKLGNNDISAMYLMIFYLIFIFLIKRSKISVDKNNKNYLLLIMFNFILYFIMTIICNYELTSSGISSMIGFLKIPILIILFCSLFPGEIKNQKSYDRAFKCLLVINLFGVLLQFMYGSQIRSFFESMYLTNDYTYYSTLASWEVYNRKFGFFASPMLLGIFCLTTFLYFLLSYKKSKNNKYLIWTAVSLAVGLTSLSKTFIIGVPLTVIIYFFVNIGNKKKKTSINQKRRQNNFLKICICLPIVLFVFSKLYIYLTENTTIIYYIQMLSNPLSALETRYSANSDNLLLSDTYNVIKEHLIFGVGFQSINNEFLGDSSYIMSLHNGGLISLISIIIFYLLNLIKAIKRKNIDKILFIIIWAISGLAMPTIYNTIVVLPFYLYFFNSKDVSHEEINKIY